MIIKNVRIFTPEHAFKWGTMIIENGCISAVFDEEESSTNGSDGASEDETDDEEAECIDGRGCLAIPGLIDIHLHGAMGYDACDGTKEALEHIAAYELQHGITSFAPATLTLPEEKLLSVLESIRKYCGYVNQIGNYVNSSSGYVNQNENYVNQSTVIGINMEGPFISEAKCGAQDSRYVIPSSPALVEKFYEASGGLLKIIGFAPEEHRMSDIPAILKKCPGIHVALTHTDATYEQAKRALIKGADHITHLFNGMSAFHHRNPGVAGAAFDHDSATAELICDGEHVHPVMVRTAFKMLSPNRVIMISDSMRATGLADGTYKLGDLDVAVHGSKATLVSDEKALAGSVTNLYDCMKKAVLKMKIPLEQVLPTVTENPAKKMGVFENCGSIEAGKTANILLVDDDLNLQKILFQGRWV